MTESVREAVGAFQDAKALEAAVDELLLSGFGRADLSLLASGETVEAKLGHSFASTRELEDEPEVPTAAYVARESVGDAEGAVIGGLLYIGALAGMLPVLASGGAVAAALVGTVAGGAGGAAVGGVLADMIGRSHAEALTRQLERGGIILWVRTRDAEHEERATSILARHGAEDVHVHGIPDRREALRTRYAMHPQSREAGVVHEAHAGEDLAIMPDGHCYAAGRLFASETEARRYLDRFAEEP